MSNKTLVAIGAVLIVVLVLPLIPQAFQTLTSEQKVDAAPSGTLGQNVADAAPAPPQLPPAPPAPSIMTRMQFDQVRSGMTYAQCVQFIGSEGERVQYPRTAGDEEYTWQMVDTPGSTAITAVASLRFKNGMMYGKGFNSAQRRRPGPHTNMLSSVLPAQRPAAPPYICRPVYDALVNGCTYAECVQQLGVEGQYAGRISMSGGTYSANGAPIPAVGDVFVWYNPATAATLKLSFRDGKLTAREVSGAGAATGGSGGSR